MLLTPPRLVDVLLGLVFLVVNTGVFACSYFLLLHTSSEDPFVQEVKITIVCYGYLQNIIGFIAGLWLARITQAGLGSGEQSEEEMLLMEKLEEEHELETVVANA